MRNYKIEDTVNNIDRHKLFLLTCNKLELPKYISFIQEQKINVINIGREIAEFINNLEDYIYLNLDVYDYLKKLIDIYKQKVNNNGNDVLAIYNFGILLENRLELNATQILQDFSKTIALILVWENEVDDTNLLTWPTQKNIAFFNLSETSLKRLQHEI